MTRTALACPDPEDPEDGRRANSEIHSSDSAEREQKMSVHDSLDVDLTNYKSRVGARVPQGDYEVIVVATEKAQSAAGNTMVTTWLRIAEGEFAGQVIVDRLTMTERSLFRVVGFLSAVGIPTPNKRLSVPLRQLENRRLLISVEDGEPYIGTIKSEVRNYQPSRSIGTSDAALDLPEPDELPAGQSVVAERIPPATATPSPEPAAEAVNGAAASAPAEQDAPAAPAVAVPAAEFSAPATPASPTAGGVPLSSISIDDL